jgi:hypothetical protein
MMAIEMPAAINPYSMAGLLGVKPCVNDGNGRN